MSLVFIGLQAVAATFRTSFINRAVPVRCISRSSKLFSEENEEENANANANEEFVDPAKDRRNPVPYETSIRYLASDAYKETYGNDPVWKLYRRNHKGMYAPKKTRKTCIRQGIISTGNPCPICRDEYLVFDHRNIGLLQQFISEYNGEILSYQKTGICQKQHHNLLVSIIRAKYYGTIVFDVPFREYNYSDWYKPESESQQSATQKN